MADRIGRAYRDLRATLKQRWQDADAPCWHCGQPIDYNGSANAPGSFEYDHAAPVATHPHLELDPRNGRPSHTRCNRSRGTRTPRPSIGESTEQW